MGRTGLDYREERMRLAVGATPVWGPLRRIQPEACFRDTSAAIRAINEDLPSGWPMRLEDRLFHRPPRRLPLEPATIQNPLVANVRFLHIISQEHGRRRNRPPSEEAAQYLWEQFALRPLTQENILEASRLLGGEPRLRRGKMFTSKFESGHFKEFVAGDQVEARLDRLLRRIAKVEPKLDPLLHAVGVFFETTLIHPLADGNGRLARLLFQVSLQRTVGLKAPILPLGPACAANRAALVGAFLAWEYDHNPRPLVEFVNYAIEDLIGLYVKGKQQSPVSAG